MSDDDESGGGGDAGERGGGGGEARRAVPTWVESLVLGALSFIIASTPCSCVGVLGTNIAVLTIVRLFEVV